MAHPSPSPEDDSEELPQTTPSSFFSRPNLISVLCLSSVLALLFNAVFTIDLSFLPLSHGHRVKSVQQNALAQLNTTLALLRSSNLTTLVEAPRGPMTALRKRQARVNYSEVWMSVIEVDVILHHLADVSTYLEWGSGGSTKNFAQFATVAAHSIEHDEKWCAKMKKEKPATLNITIHCIPVKRGYMGWGIRSPFEEGNYTIFKPYVDHISKLGVDTFDFILVDGRARIPAAVKALSYITDKSVVVLHDAERAFTAHAGYERIWNYYDHIDSVGGSKRQGVLVLKRKRKFSDLTGQHDKVQEILDRKFG